MRIWIGILILLVVFTGSACTVAPSSAPAAASGDNSSQATVVQVSLVEMKVILDRTEIPAGPVTFNITNDGKYRHEAVLEMVGAINEPLLQGEISAAVRNLQPGQSATLNWTLDQPGSYQLACHLPGHYEAGMVETFTVTAAGN